MTRTLVSLIAIIVVVLGIWYFANHGATTPTPISVQPIATVMYQCNDNKTITASFYAGSSTPATSPNQPPTPGGSAHVVLSDGRTFDLPQTISADGARYSNGDPSVQGSETLVFWSKGNGALVLENNQDQTYIGCISVPNDPGGLPQVYESGQNGFALRYPAGYTVDEQYAYQELGPGQDINGVKFTIDPSVATGTNLAADSYLSVEQIPQTQNCSAALFLSSDASVATTTDNGTQYSVGSTTGAGAGNRYDEEVYAIPGTNPCIGVRYFIHYGVLENYPAGSVTQFDENALTNQFDAIRRTLTIVQS